MKKCLSFLMAVVLLLTFVPAHAYISLPASLEVIEASAFENDSSITGVFCVTDDVQSIGDRAFAGTGIYALQLPAACQNIGDDILADTNAVYIYMEEYAALDEATLDSVDYVFVENGPAAYPDEKYIPVSSLMKLDGLYYLISDEGMYPLCVVNPAELSEVTIHKICDDMPVVSLEKFVPSGCENILFRVPAYLNIPEGMNAESYASLLMTPITSLPNPPVVGQLVEFSTTVTNNWGNLEYEWDYWYDKSADRPVNTWTTDFYFKITPSSEGELTVSLTVTDELGDTNTETATFTVRPYIEFVLSAISAGDVYAGSSATFAVEPAGASGDVSYEWTFTGSDFSDTIATSEPFCSYTPASVGMMSVSVTATDADGRTAESSASFDTKCSGITLQPLTLDKPFVVGEESLIIVDAQCSCEIDSLNWEIDFADKSTGGVSMVLEDIAFTPSVSGTHTVHVSVKDQYGNSSEQTAVFTAANPPLAISAPTSEDALYVGTAAEFTVEVLNAEGSVSYAWIVSGPGGDEAFSTSVPSLTYTPSVSGEYTISVTASDSNGREASSSEVFTIASSADAAVSMPYTDSELLAGKTVLFAVDALSDCEIVTYHWMISGEGVNEEFTTTEPALSYTARTAGDYIVSITITDAVGKTASSSADFTFRCGAIALGAPIVPESITANESFVITVDASCFCTIADYEWTIEGPVASYAFENCGSSITFTPEFAGQYTVTVTATDADGNASTSSSIFMVECGGLTVSDIIADSTPAVGLQTVFSVEVDCDCETVSYQWTADTGSSAASATTSVMEFIPNSTGSCTVTVIVTDAAGNSVTRSAEYEINDAVIYRALLIGNTYPGTVDELPGPDNDIAAMANMLALQTQTPFDVSSKLNATASQIRSAITSELGDADSNDVSLFYYSGHGTSQGHLCGVNSTFISVDELRSYLDTVPGKKIVLLDSCYSGMHIGKSIGTDSGDSFNNAVISAFGSSKARGNLATDDYVVMTACSQKQMSQSLGYGYSDGSEFWFGAFTYGLTLSSGFDMDYWDYTTPWADYYGNNDGSITLGEAYDVVVDIVENEFGLEQSTQYHGDTDYILWGY